MVATTWVRFPDRDHQSTIGLVVKFNVAIVEPRVRFSDGARLLLQTCSRAVLSKKRAQLVSSGDNLVRMLPACEGREKENFPDPDNAGCKDAKG